MKLLRYLLLATAFGCAQVSHRQPFGTGPEPLTIEERVLSSVIDATHTIPGPLQLPAPFCVSFWDTVHDGPIPGPKLSRLHVSVQLVPAGECPPTYASMIRVVDSLGRPVGPPRPQGYVDPYHLRIWRPVRVTDTMLVVRIEATQGTPGWSLYCEVRMDNPSHASCGTARQWVS